MLTMCMLEALQPGQAAKRHHLGLASRCIHTINLSIMSMAGPVGRSNTLKQQRILWDFNNIDSVRHVLGAQ